MLNPQRSLKEGYELSDINIRVVFIFLTSVALLTFLGIMAALIVLRGLEARPSINPIEVSPLAASQVAAGFDAPKIQGNPRLERDLAIATAEARLHSYGMVSLEPEMERAHIPIDRAMELVASGKVPYRQPVTVALEEEEAVETSTTTADTPETPGTAGE